MNAKKRALGKGLSALLDNADYQSKQVYDAEKDILPVGTIGRVPIDIIESNPYQPRTDFDEEAMQDLAASIKEQGIIQPITLRKLDFNKLQLISGERRLKAAKMAGLTDIPAYIVVAEEHAVLEMAIVENIQRENLNPLEIALGYQQLIQNYELTQEMLSERLGKSRSSITNYLRLLKLPAEIQLGLRQELISMGHAKALLAMEKLQNMLDVYQDILVQQLSVRDTEIVIQELNSRPDHEGHGGEEGNKKRSVKIMASRYQKQLCKQLEGSLQTRVSIRNKKDGKGTLLIAFASDDELERIATRLNE